MNEGWVKLHRAVCESAVFMDAEVLQLWLYLLCNATYEEQELLYCGKVIHLKKGELIIGRKLLAKKLHTKESKIYRALKLLQELGNIDIQANNKYSIATIVNWAKYQDDFKKVNSKTTAKQQQDNSKATAGQQQGNTYKEIKEYKECKEGGEEYACVRACACEEAPPTTPPPTLEEIRSFCSERNSSVNPVRFYNYNSSRNWQGVTDWRLKIEEWESNEYASEDKEKAEKLGTYMSAGGHGEGLDLDAFDEANRNSDSYVWKYEV